MVHFAFVAVNAYFIVTTTRGQPGLRRRADWFRLVVGLFLVFGLFHWTATILGSDRGQRGILVAALGRRRNCSRQPGFCHIISDVAAVRQLGLGLPRAKGIVVAGGVALLLLMAALLFVRARG